MPNRNKPSNPDDVNSALFRKSKTSMKRYSSNIVGTIFKVKSMKQQTNVRTSLFPLIKISNPLSKLSDVSIIYGPGSKNKVRTISQLCGEDIGSLVILKAIVVRAGVVKPQIVVATYACDVCGC